MDRLKAYYMRDTPLSSGRGGSQNSLEEASPQQQHSFQSVRHDAAATESRCCESEEEDVLIDYNASFSETSFGAPSSPPPGHRGVQSTVSGSDSRYFPRDPVVSQPQHGAYGFSDAYKKQGTQMHIAQPHYLT